MNRMKISCFYSVVLYCFTVALATTTQKELLNEIEVLLGLNSICPMLASVKIVSTLVVPTNMNLR